MLPTEVQVTLIVGYAADDYVVLASERMITWRRGKRDDHNAITTKTTCVAGQSLMGFSGVADLAGNTETFLAHVAGEVLSTPSLRGQLTRYLAQRIGEELDKKRTADPRIRPADLWFALLVVGYGPGADGSPTRYLRVISNAIDGKYNQLRVTDHRGFYAHHPSVDVAGDGFRLWAIGDCPEKSKLEETAEALVEFRRRHPGHGKEIARQLARVIVARAKDSPGVGSTVQAAILPRAAFGQQSITMYAVIPPEPIEEILSFEFNSAVNDEGHVLVNGINLVVEGMEMIGGGAVWGSIDPIGPRPPFAPPKRGP